MKRVEKLYVDKLVPLKSLALILFKISPEFLIVQKSFFTGSLICFFTVLDNMFLTAVRHEVNNLESSVVVQELELAIKLAL